MISPVSFTGTFKVNNRQNSPSKFSLFKRYRQDLYRLNQKSDINIISREEKIRKTYHGALEPRAEETLIVPDKMDVMVQDFCAQNGIVFNKLYTHDLLDSRKVVSRIKEAPKGYKTVNVDVSRLEELIQSQKTNIPAYEDAYKHLHLPDVKAMVLEGSNFPATTLRIDPMEGYFCSNDYKSHVLEQYVDIHGVQNLNNQQTGIYLVDSEDGMDCYTYFLLKNLGMDEIPVYVDDLTYRAGLTLGLFHK